MLLILRPRSSDPALDHKRLTVRLVFVLIALMLAALYWRWGLREGMPTMVPSTSRRRGGPDVMWNESQISFTVRFLVNVLPVGLVVFLGDALAERVVSRRPRTRPRTRTRYPY